MAGFVEHPAMFWKKWCCSSFEVNEVLFGVKLTVAGREALEVCCCSRSSLCLVLEEQKSISHTGM
jgi:hypothetical protein